MLHAPVPAACVHVHTHTHMYVCACAHAHAHTYMCMSFTLPKMREIDEEADSDKGFHEEGVKEEAWERIWSRSLIS